MKIICNGVLVEDRNNSIRITKDRKGVECGCTSPNYKFVAHMDGKEIYSNVFNCTCCGNVITQTFKRNGKFKENGVRSRGRNISSCTSGRKKKSAHMTSDKLWVAKDAKVNVEVKSNE